MQIIHIRETDSTNNFLKELLSGQALPESTVVYTDFQTAGKGQRGNSWESQKGENLLFSILLYPNMLEAGEQFLVSQVVSLGVANALSKYTKGITIKWPNDIYWKEKKICGILIENSLEGDCIRNSICGVGININQLQFESSVPNPVSLKQITGCEYDRNTLLDEVLECIDSFYSKLKRREFDFIRSQYKKSLYRKEGYYLYNDSTSDFEARIKGIEDNGILVLETGSGEERRFAFKEIKYR